MRLAEKAGLIEALARFLRPVMRWLFPEVPVNHPAMGSMVMNMAANALGLTNAATPMGLRAMKDLETLNPHPGTATNAMCTFLAINTGSVQLIPITAIAILAAGGSTNPTAIIATTLMATCCTFAAGLLAVKGLEKTRWFRLPAVDPTLRATAEVETVEESPPARLPGWGAFVLTGLALCFGWFVVYQAQVGQSVEPAFPRYMNALSIAAVPFLILFFPVYAAVRGVKVYEEAVEGAKEGFQVAVRIIPYLVIMLVAITMFRNAGGIDLITRALQPLLVAVNFPPELVPMSLMRPLSGSGSLALLSDLVKQVGPDHLITRMAATLYGSSETTFYVIAVYFGAVNVFRTRHAVAAGLIADVVGVIASVIFCRLVFS
jgi:spore maturation protein SpmA